jgi:hypothetical protein
VSCLAHQLVPPNTAQAAAAPCSRPGSSRSSVSCSAGRRPRHKNSNPDIAVPSSLTDALQQAKFFAPPGSSCPSEAFAKLQAMNVNVGGRFYLISCGEYEEKHPQAGKPARALLQMVLVSIEADPTGASVYKLRGTPTQIQVAVKPQDMGNPMLYFIVYQLGEDGWPNGESNTTHQVCRVNHYFILQGWWLGAVSQSQLLGLKGTVCLLCPLPQSPPHIANAAASGSRLPVVAVDCAYAAGVEGRLSAILAVVP